MVTVESREIQLPSFEEVVSDFDLASTNGDFEIFSHIQSHIRQLLINRPRIGFRQSVDFVLLGMFM